jgi:hypothetical protein
MGGHSWERHVDEVDPKFFKRAGGAQVYGVKTGLGISLTSTLIGRMVVALYSTRDMEEDEKIVQLCMNEFAKLSPEPKWTLVVNMGPTSDSAAAPLALNGGDARESVAMLSSSSGIDHYHHSALDLMDQKLPPKTSSSFPSIDANAQNVSALADCGEEASSQRVECSIAMLLGDHIPLSDSVEPTTTSTTPDAPVPSVLDFMSLRLMLLRSSSRRSDHENETIEIIKKSYEGYSRDQRRTEKQIACLLVNDWVFLNGKAQPAEVLQADTKPPAKANDSSAYQSHVLEAGSLPVTSGVPIRMPALFSADRSLVRRGSSLDLVMTRTGSQPSPLDYNMMESHNIFIVDDNSEENS